MVKDKLNVKHLLSCLIPSPSWCWISFPKVLETFIICYISSVAIMYCNSCLWRMLNFYSSVFQADPRFVWNKSLLEELIELKVRYYIYSNQGIIGLAFRKCFPFGRKNREKDVLSKTKQSYPCNSSVSIVNQFHFSNVQSFFSGGSLMSSSFLYFKEISWRFWYLMSFI